MWWPKIFSIEHSRHIKWSKYIFCEGIEFHYIDFKKIAWMIACNVSYRGFRLRLLDPMIVSFDPNDLINHSKKRLRWGGIIQWDYYLLEDKQLLKCGGVW